MADSHRIILKALADLRPDIILSDYGPPSLRNVGGKGLATLRE